MSSCSTVLSICLCNSAMSVVMADISTQEILAVMLMSCGAEETGAGVFDNTVLQQPKCQRLN